MQKIVSFSILAVFALYALNGLLRVGIVVPAFSGSFALNRTLYGLEKLNQGLDDCRKNSLCDVYEAVRNLGAQNDFCEELSSAPIAARCGISFQDNPHAKWGGFVVNAEGYSAHINLPKYDEKEKNLALYRPELEDFRKSWRPGLDLSKFEAMHTDPREWGDGSMKGILRKLMIEEN